LIGSLTNRNAPMNKLTKDINRDLSRLRDELERMPSIRKQIEEQKSVSKDLLKYIGENQNVLRNATEIFSEMVRRFEFLGEIPDLFESNRVDLSRSIEELKEGYKSVSVRIQKLDDALVGPLEGVRSEIAESNSNLRKQRNLLAGIMTVVLLNLAVLFIFWGLQQNLWVNSGSGSSPSV